MLFRFGRKSKKRGSSLIIFSLFAVILVFAINPSIISTISKCERCSSPKPNSPNSSSEILFDSIELFKPPLDILEINATFQKDYIYYFEIESYVPFSEFVSVDIYCTSPDNRIYHYFDYETELENNITTIYFEYGVAEQGVHEIKIEVHTSSNVNLRIYIEERESLENYYESGFDIGILHDLLLYETDISRYSSNVLEKQYQFPLVKDNEYYFNFFRVNPLSNSDKIANNYENPNVMMKVILNGSEFEYYPIIPTLNFSLRSNLEFLGIGEGSEQYNMHNNSFKIRFGSHATGNATVTLKLDSIPSFNLNFAFIAYCTGEIGDGPDENETIITDSNQTANETITNLIPKINSTDLHDASKSYTDVIDDFITKGENFIDKNFWVIISGLVGAIGLMFTINLIISKNKIRQMEYSDKREDKIT